MYHGGPWSVVREPLAGAQELETTGRNSDQTGNAIAFSPGRPVLDGLRTSDYGPRLRLDQRSGEQRNHDLVMADERIAAADAGDGP